MNDGPGTLAERDLEREAMRAELERLGLVDLQNRWEQQPDRHVVSFGGGKPAIADIKGNPEDAFHGVVIVNPTGRDVTVGFNVSAAVGGALTVPGRTSLVWPAQYTNLSLGVSATDASTGLAESLIVLRLRYPPDVGLFSDRMALAASTIVAQPEDAKVAGASVAIVAANANRRGLEIVNVGGKAVRIMLGEAAKAKHGLWLAPEGGTWNGQVSGATWLGEVNAITDSGEETTVAVVES